MIIEWTSHNIALQILCLYVNYMRRATQSAVNVFGFYVCIDEGRTHTSITSTYVHICTYYERYKDNWLQFYITKISVKRLQIVCMSMCVCGTASCHPCIVISLGKQVFFGQMKVPSYQVYRRQLSLWWIQFNWSVSFKCQHNVLNDSLKLSS